MNLHRIKRFLKRLDPLALERARRNLIASRIMRQILYLEDLADQTEAEGMTALAVAMRCAASHHRKHLAINCLR